MYYDIYITTLSQNHIIEFYLVIIARLVFPRKVVKCGVGWMLSGQIGSCDTKDSGIVSGGVKVYLDQVCSSPVFLSAYFCSGLTLGQGRS